MAQDSATRQTVKTGVENKLSKMINFVHNKKMAIPARTSSVTKGKVSLYYPIGNRQKILVTKMK
jgi:hypothetical protein